MPLNDIYLGESGGLEISLTPFGRKFREGEEHIYREGRCASGRLVRDIIATKKKFTITYNYIDDVELHKILDIFNFNTTVTLKIRRLDDTVDSYEVLMEPFDRDRAHIKGNGLWTGVSLEFREV